MFIEMDENQPGWDEKAISNEDIDHTKDENKYKFKHPLPNSRIKFSEQQNFLMRKYFDDENPAQQGGDVLLDEGGRILKVFKMDNVNDRVDLGELGLL